MFSNWPVVNCAQCEFADVFDAAEGVELVVLFPLAARERGPWTNRVFAFEQNAVQIRAVAFLFQPPRKRCGER